MTGEIAAANATGSQGREAPAAIEEPLVLVRDLSVAYGAREVLSGVELEIRRGRVTAVIGPSGCGKTTLLSCLNRLTDLVPGCRVRGTVRFEGRELTDPGLDLLALRRAVGMLFQRPNPFPLSIRANLHLPLREHGCPRARRDALAEEVLRRVGLWEEIAERLDRPAQELSGGQQQRLCLARALTLSPRLLLMDEPCSSLDPLSTETIEELIRGLRGAYTTVIVTHNLAQARRLADDVIVLWARDGAARVIESGPVQEVFGRPRDPDTAAYVGGLRG